MGITFKITMDMALQVRQYRPSALKLHLRFHRRLLSVICPERCIQACDHLVLIPYRILTMRHRRLSICPRSRSLTRDSDGRICFTTDDLHDTHVHILRAIDTLNTMHLIQRYYTLICISSIQNHTAIQYQYLLLYHNPRLYLTISFESCPRLLSGRKPKVSYWHRWGIVPLV